MFHLIRSSAFAIIAGTLFYIGINSSQQVHAEAAPAPASAEAPAKHRSKTLIDLYKEGGWVMHMIALTSIATLSTLSFCIIAINRKKVVPPALLAALNEALQTQDVSNSAKPRRRF